MQSTVFLPESYCGTDYVNLHTDKKRYALLNVISFLIGAILIFLGWLWRGFEPLLELLQMGIATYYLWLVLLAVGILLQIAAHQLLHGLFMKHFSGLPSYYGRKGLIFKYAGNESYFCRRHYLLIAIAPAAITGIFLAALTVLFGGAWFWLFYCLQIYNLGSSVGDYYYFGMALRAPKRALFHDDGIGVAVFTEETK